MHVLLLVVVVLCSVCSGQPALQNVASGCQHYNHSLTPLTRDLCAPFISTEVYVPVFAPTILGALDLQLANTSSFKLINTVKSILPLGCYKALLSLMCQTAFPTCTRVVNETDGSWWEAPVYPCKSMCQTALLTCASVFANLQGAALDCNQQIPKVGGDQWPDGPSYVTVVDIMYSPQVVPVQQCAFQRFPPNASEIYSNPKNISCPSVFGHVSNPELDTDTLCAYKCPDPSYTTEEYKGLNDLTLGIAVTAFTLQVFLFASYLVDSKKREFPARVQIYECISAIGLTIGAILGGTDPTNNTICVDETTYSTQSNNSLCATQAVLLVFFAYACCLWCMVMAIISYICVVLEIRPKIVQPYEKYAHLVVWGMSTGFTVAAVAMHATEIGPGGRTWCFIKIDSDKSHVDFGLFYVPVTLFAVIIFTFFVLVLRKLFVFEFATVKTGRKGLRTTVKAQRRILLLLIGIAILFVIIFVMRYTFTPSKINRVIAGTKKWANCKVMSEFGFPVDGPCGDTNPSRRGYGEIMLQNAALASVGFWFFFAFGTDPLIYIEWYNLLKLLFTGEWRKLVERVKVGDTRTSTGSRPSGNYSSSNSKSAPSEPKQTGINLADMSLNNSASTLLTSESTKSLTSSIDIQESGTPTEDAREETGGL